MTAEDIAESPDHGSLLDGGFALDVAQTSALHRKLGEWLASRGDAGRINVHTSTVEAVATMDRLDD